MPTTLFGVAALDNRHARKTRLRHLVYDDTQRLVRKRGQDIPLHDVVECDVVADSGPPIARPFHGSEEKCLMWCRNPQAPDNPERLNSVSTLSNNIAFDC
jgi:hypothetical protein